MLGNQWLEASGFVGLWGLTSAITIVLSHYCSEVYRAKGRPRLSVLSQWLHMIVLFPVVLIAIKYGFEALYISRSLVRLELVFVNLIIMYWLVKISPIAMLKNIAVPCVAAVGMWLISSLLLNNRCSLLWQIFSVVICGISYIGFICCFRKEKELMKSFLCRIKSRK